MNGKIADTKSVAGFSAMTVKSYGLTGIGSLLLALCLPVLAHHGQAGIFDQEQFVEMAGVVREWSFVNPHPVLVLEVADESGEMTEWDVYFGPAAVSALGRRGFSRDTFEIGESLIVKGHPATAAGARGIDVWGADSVVTRADGTSVP